MKETTIVIGTIVKAQGIRGEIKVAPATDDVNRFSKLKYVLIDGAEYKVTGSRTVNGVFLTLNGVNERSSAELLKNKQISVYRKDAVKLGEDSNFIIDLIGCNIIQGGKTIGVLSDILQYGSADIYVCKDGNGINFMFPALKKIVTHVNTDAKIIEVSDAIREVLVYDN